MGGVCNTSGMGEKFIHIFVRKPEGKGPRRRPKGRSEEMFCEGVDWVRVRIGTGGGLL